MRKPKGKSPKNAATVDGARHTVQAAAVLLGRAMTILHNMEDSDQVRVRIKVALDAVHNASKRLNAESKFLNWRDRKRREAGDPTLEIPAPEHVR